MKAIVKKFATPGLWMEDVPVPKCGDNDVLIKVRKNAICGTDLNIYKWEAWAQKNVPVPLTIGHEFVGEIAELGSNVKNFNVGMRVTAEGHITCGTCISCRKELKHLCLNTIGLGYHCDGAFAEYVRVPAENIFPLPPSIPDDIAAIFDPYGNTVHTALTFPLTGEDVLITGAGPIGVMAAAIAKKSGARKIVVTDLNDYRLNLAKKMGATHTVNVGNSKLEETMKQAGIDTGFTVGLEMSGSPRAFNSMIENMQHGGNIALLGILPPGTTIDWDLVIFPMLTIKGIYGRKIFTTWYQMQHLLESGLDLQPIITHQFPIDDFEKGFEIMKSGQCGKVILNWN